MVCIYCSQVMKIHQSAVILLLVVCAPLSSYSQTYQQFINKHLAPAGMKIDDCTAKILELKINQGTDCKKTNTFIQATEDEIANLCTNTNIYSGKKFDVIVCTGTSLNNKAPCKYRSKSKKNHTLTVTCENYLPVHYGPPRSTNG